MLDEFYAIEYADELTSLLFKNRSAVAAVPNPVSDLTLLECISNRRHCEKMFNANALI